MEIHGAGRTDAGVHALCQTANMHLDTALTPCEIRDYLNAWLPEDIGIVSLEEAAAGFTAPARGLTLAEVNYS